MFFPQKKLLCRWITQWIFFSFNHSWKSHSDHKLLQVELKRCWATAVWMIVIHGVMNGLFQFDSNLWMKKRHSHTQNSRHMQSHDTKTREKKKIQYHNCISRELENNTSIPVHTLSFNLISTRSPLPTRQCKRMKRKKYRKWYTNESKCTRCRMI